VFPFYCCLCCLWFHCVAVLAVPFTQLDCCAPLDSVKISVLSVPFPSLQLGVPFMWCLLWSPRESPCLSSPAWPGAMPRRWTSRTVTACRWRVRWCPLAVFKRAVLTGMFGSALSEFRAAVEQNARQSEVAMVLSYSRKVLGQTGSGHFSPIGGYNKRADMVLLLDVVRSFGWLFATCCVPLGVCRRGSSTRPTGSRYRLRMKL
jgi:Phytochelatin synthase